MTDAAATQAESAHLTDPKLWYELHAEKHWSALWSDYVLCGACPGIRQVHNACTACGAPPPDCGRTTVRLVDETEEPVLMVLPGAEGRFEDYLYLQMMEREWKRPIDESEQSPSLLRESGPSPRAAIVVLFWTYFETRIDRLFRTAMRDLPVAIRDDCLRRYSFVGQRLDQLYRIVFNSTYASDLIDLGYEDVWQHLSRLQKRRNDFAHGIPQAIDDPLVKSVVEMLKREHDAWIAVFNRRVACQATP